MSLTPLEVALLPPGEPAADAELDRFFDACPTSFAQQTRHWRDVIAGLGADEPLFLGCRRDGELVGVLPGYRFAGPLGAILTSVPQAGPLGGVAVRRDPARDPRHADGAAPEDAVYAALLHAYVALAEERGCVLASVISNPIWPDSALYERWFRPDYTLENSCLVVDLEEALTDAGELADAPKGLRRNLRRAESGALRIDEAQSPANLDAWYAIHEQRHREIGATPLPRALFAGALEHMVPAGAARFFFVRRVDTDEMVAGGFYVCHGRTIDALMPALRSDSAKLAPNFLLAIHSMRWARARGLRFYNWQPSPPSGGVDRFKRQWGGRDRIYHYFTRVTGDVRRVLESSPAELAAGYPWHYVLPFDRLGSAPGEQGAASTRAAAWTARESAR